MMDRRITIEDLAKELELSVSTVSRALSGRGYVAAMTRDRILSHANHRGYVPDLNARSLRSGVSREIGLVVSSLEDPFYAQLVTGFEEVARQRGYSVILFLNHGQLDVELQVAHSLIAKGVSGVAITPVESAAVEILAAQNRRVLQLDRIITNTVSAVSGDNMEGGRIATGHLLDRGHERIAFVIDHTKWTTGQARLFGYEQAHKDRSVLLDRTLTIELGESRTEILSGARDLLSKIEDLEVTAVFAANSVVGEIFYSVCLDGGVEIPDELSLLTYDDLTWAGLVRPAVTTIDQNVSQMGSIAARTLIDSIEDGKDFGPNKTVLIPPTLVQRDSVQTRQ
ncbi:transcriptional regulator, LacI family [Ruaniaceae bacterium KH17]|nr:transcriptional regulator, LacI family [Ruaniaceae bacterium KH17]